MLALVMMLTLSQCTKDTDCKGARICSNGACVTPEPGEGAPAVLTPPAFAQPPLRPDPVRISEEIRLRHEIAELHHEREDATVGAPVFKLISGGVLVGLAGVLGNVYSGNRNTGTGAAGLVCLVAGVGLLIWGGIQLPIRLFSRTRIDNEIRLKEEQLRAFETAR